MSTDQFTETPVAGTSRADYAKFVAAARWLRANGWTYDRTDFFTSREWRWWDKPIVGNQISIFATEGKLSQFSVVGNDFDFGSQDTTVAQAIDFLVVAGILPAEFSSTSCTYCEVAR